MKKVLTIILTALIFCISIIPAHAIDDYGVMPCYNNVASQRTGFDISSSGEATVSVTIRGYQGVTTRIVITYEIQKKLIGNIWQDVDGAGWRGENTGNSFSITHSYQLPESDEYRLSYMYEVYGTEGEPDVITGFEKAEY